MSVNLPVFTKYAGETKEIRLDFSDLLVGSVTASTATVAVEGRYTGTDATSTIAVSSTGTVASPYVSGDMQAGTAGDQYLVTYTAALSDSNVAIKKFFLRILGNQDA